MNAETFRASQMDAYAADGNHLGLNTFWHALANWVRNNAPDTATALREAKWVFDNLIKPVDRIPDAIDDLFIWPAIALMIERLTKPTPPPAEAPLEQAA